MTAQPAFWEETYPAGFHVLRGYVGASQQEQIYRLTRQLARVAPFVTPVMPNGAAFRLEVSSWGPVGWFADGIGYAYLRFHPATKKPWPVIPDLVWRVLEGAAREVGYSLRLDTVLVNYYPAEQGSLGAHQDKNEDDQISPIVTLSLGDGCRFGMGHVHDKTGMRFTGLDSGDVVVMGGPARMAYHSVQKLYPGSSKLLKDGGRLSLTGRKVFL